MDSVLLAKLDAHRAWIRDNPPADHVAPVMYDVETGTRLVTQADWDLCYRRAFENYSKWRTALAALVEADDAENIDRLHDAMQEARALLASDPHGPGPVKVEASS